MTAKRRKAQKFGFFEELLTDFWTNEKLWNWKFAITFYFSIPNKKIRNDHQKFFRKIAVLKFPPQKNCGTFRLGIKRVLPWIWKFHFQTSPPDIFEIRYGFEWAFFTRRRFSPYAPSLTFLARFCDSNAGRYTPSRIFLCACPHRAVLSGWRMDLNYSYCSYKIIDLSTAPVSHEV